MVEDEGHLGMEVRGTKGPCSPHGPNRIAAVSIKLGPAAPASGIATIRTSTHRDGGQHERHLGGVQKVRVQDVLQEGADALVERLGADYGIEDE